MFPKNNEKVYLIVISVCKAASGRCNKIGVVGPFAERFGKIATRVQSPLKRLIALMKKLRVIVVAKMGPESDITNA